MRIQDIKQLASSIKNNLRGWTTDRKIIVFESDDWGSIRMPSAEVYQKCLKAGYMVDKNPFERYDSLASEEDLELLFEVLSTYIDKNGRHPVFTANSAVANPDFTKIQESNFTQYHFQNLQETFSDYPNHKNNLKLWKLGISNGVFFPQFHAREHLNVSLFMSHLQMKKSDVLFGFNHKMPGSMQLNNPKDGNIYVEATNASSVEDKAVKKNILLEGLQLFEELFGYKSSSYIPTNYIVSPDYFSDLYAHGVKYIQGGSTQYEPDLQGGFIHHKRYTGEKDKSGLVFLKRNCTFEPTVTQKTTEVDRCLKDIQMAFLFKKPAIINTHRLNYVGTLDSSNRDKNLKYLKQLLAQIIKKWPDVEFMNSVELGDLITQ